MCIKKSRRITSLLVALLLIASLSSLLYGCKSSEPESEPLQMTDSEAVTILNSLIPESEKINEIFWGKGLEAEKADDNTLSVIFLPVSEECEYQTVADIKSAAEKVYSKSYLSSSVYTSIFDGVASESADGVVDFAIDPRYKEIGGRLYVNTTYTPLELKTKLLIDTAKVVSTDAYSVTVRMSYETSGNASGELDIKLVPQDGEWRLDTPSY